MSVLCRLLGTLAGAAGLIGVLACIGGIVGGWSLHNELSHRLDHVFARVSDSLAGLGGDVVRARDELLQARRELNAVRPDKAGPAYERGGRPLLAGKGMAAIRLQLGEAKPQLLRAVEFGLVANGLLEALSDLWLTERAGVDTDRLSEAADQLAVLTGKAQKLATLIDGPTDAGAADEPSKLSEMVDRILVILDQAADRAGGARERAAARHDRVRRFITLATWALTGLLVWIGMGQLSLFVHGRAMMRRIRCTAALTPDSGMPTSSGSGRSSRRPRDCP